MNQKQAPQRKPILENNTKSSKIRILSVAPINPQIIFGRQHTPELSIQYQKKDTDNQLSKNRNYLAQNMSNKQQNYSNGEQKIQQLKNKLESMNYQNPYNYHPPKQQIKSQNTYHRPPTSTQDQENYIQDKKTYQIQTIQPEKGWLAESNYSIESETSQVMQPNKQTDIIVNDSNVIGQKRNSIESQMSLSKQTTAETNIDMYASIMIEQKMNCKSCCFIIDQDAFVTNCQHAFHYNCLRDTIKSQLNNRSYNITCICQTKLTQNLIKNLETVLKENFFDKLISNQIERMKIQYQPFIAECGRCKYFCIEIGNPKSTIGDNAQFICPNCTKRPDLLYNY